MDQIGLLMDFISSFLLPQLNSFSQPPHFHSLPYWLTKKGFAYELKQKLERKKNSKNVNSLQICQ